MKRNAFTMLELVFVIVVIGILASIAVPRFAATRDDAQIAKGRSDVSAIRSSIVSERQTRLLQGSSSFVNQLDDAALDTEDETLFDDNDSNIGNGGSLLQYGVVSKDANGHWMKTINATTYIYKIINVPVTFTYDSTVGKFDCNTSNATFGNQCKMLIN